jgi:hypothetical protein
LCSCADGQKTKEMMKSKQEYILRTRAECKKTSTLQLDGKAMWRQPRLRGINKKQAEIEADCREDNLPRVNSSHLHLISIPLRIPTVKEIRNADGRDQS